MRIGGWRIEGFGPFSGYEVADLPAGLVLVSGPNEAGKTTLRDFLRGVLFGFPDKRSREALHPPVGGGVHGGTVWLVDEAGRRWTVTRRRGGRGSPTFEARGPEGEELGEDGLRRLLGGADKDLYRSVFAFDLAELASLESLEQDQVRDRIFSAGVAGAGRSATVARGKLEERASRLASARGRSVAADLRERLSALEQHYDNATQAARRYPTLRRELERLERRLEELRAARERLEALGREVEGAQRLRDELDRLEPELAAAEPRVGDAGLLAHAAEIRELQARAALAEARREEHREAEETWARREHELEAALARLPRTLSLERALEVDTAAVHEERLERLAAERQRVEARLEGLDDQLAQLETAERRVRDAAAAHGSSGAGAASAELERRVEDAKELVATLEQLEREELERRLAATVPAPLSGRLLGALLGALVLALLVAALAAAFAAGRHLGVLAGLAGAAGLAALLGLALAWRAARWRTPAAPGDRGDASGVHTGDLATRGKVLADALSFTAVPTLPEARRRVDELEAELARTRAREEEAVRLATELDDLADRRRLLEQSRDIALAHRARLEEETAEVAATSGLAGALDAATARDPAALRSVLEAVGAVKESARQRDEAAVRRLELESELEEFDRALDRLCRLLAPATDDEDASLAASLARGAPAGDVASELAEHLAAAEKRRDAWASLAKRREQLASDYEATLDRLAASGPVGVGPEGGEEHEDPPTPPRDLDLERWRVELAGRLHALEKSHEEATREHEQRRLALEDLERTADLPRLALEREELEAQLDRVLESWLVTKLAERLVTTALERYQNERQPAVVKRAGELFAAVTEGRYVALRIVAETERRRPSSIEVQRERDGTWLDVDDLSRGASEQLYLCLRLALALGFAHSAVPLPVLMDDVLVNFDPERAAGVARALSDVTAELQVLFLTCHPHLAELLARAIPDHRRIELERFA